MLIRALLLLALFAGIASAAEAPLPAEQAYTFSVRAIDSKTLEARWKIADGYYLYRDKFKFSAEPAVLGTPQLPAGLIHNDAFFGRVETYRKEVKILLPLVSAPQGDSIAITAISQGCADLGICYPPLEQRVTIGLTSAWTPGASAPSMSITPVVSADTTPTTGSGDESSQIARLLKSASVWTILLFFFGSGLALAFTPCCFPMIPIIAGIVVGHGHDISKRRALVLSLSYVAGMAVTYALAGVAAGLSGTLLANSLQNVWVLSSFALIFVVLALSMFGFYELQLPLFLQAKLSEEANRQRRGSIHGVALMGGLSAVIVGPCIAAPLAGALLYIAKTGDAAFGGIALFVMALGMGLPLIIVATSARHFLPHSGPWMESVKRMLGVMLLALAIWLITPVIPVVAQMLAWAVLLIFSAVYLHALEPLPPRAPGWQRFGKGLGITLLLAGTALLIGALAGGRDVLQPLGFLRPQVAAGTNLVSEPKFERVKTVAELETRLAATTKPVLLDFYADWCVSCKEMEHFTFSDPAVAARMNRMLLLQADVTANNPDDRALLKRFNLFGPPGIVFFDAGGREIQGLRVIGFQDAVTFGAIIDRSLSRE